MREAGVQGADCRRAGQCQHRAAGPHDDHPREGQAAQGEEAGLPEPATGVYLVRKNLNFFSLLHSCLQVQRAEHLVAAWPLPAPQAERQQEGLPRDWEHSCLTIKKRNK